MAKLRTKIRVLAVAAIGFAAAPPAHGADGARIFAPVSSWALRSDPESCLIMREFGAGGERVKFYLQAFGPGQNYKLSLSGKPLPGRTSGPLEFEMRLAGQEPMSKSVGLLESPGGVPTLAVRVGDRANNAGDDFSIAFSRGKPLALQLGPMKEPMEQLQACSNALPGEWGLEPAVQKTLSRHPMPIDMGTWLTPMQFPYNYWVASRSALINLRLMVDEQGAPSDCVIQAPRVGSTAEVIACREIVKAARFEPALDSRGLPVPSVFVTSVFFMAGRRNGNW
jgi:hypothetical protein